MPKPPSDVAAPWPTDPAGDRLGRRVDRHLRAIRRGDGGGGGGARCTAPCELGALELNHRRPDLDLVARADLALVDALPVHHRARLVAEIDQRDVVRAGDLDDRVHARREIVVDAQVAIAGPCRPSRCPARCCHGARADRPGRERTSAQPWLCLPSSDNLSKRYCASLRTRESTDQSGVEAAPRTANHRFSTDLSISGTNDVRGRISVVRTGPGRTRIVASFGPKPPAASGSSENS